MRYAGIVVAGGSARRLSGVDKPALNVGGKPLLTRAIHALEGAERVIAVGPRRPGFDVVWTREPVPGTGPVAAVAAGLLFVPEDVEAVAVLAADLPGVRRSTVDRLVAAVGGADSADGAVLVDAAGPASGCSASGGCRRCGPRCPSTRRTRPCAGRSARWTSWTSRPSRGGRRHRHPRGPGPVVLSRCFTDVTPGTVLATLTGLPVRPRAGRTDDRGTQYGRTA